jgi:hypothetical protein
VSTAWAAVGGTGDATSPPALAEPLDNCETLDTRSFWPTHDLWRCPQAAGTKTARPLEAADADAGRRYLGKVRHCRRRIDQSLEVAHRSIGA